MALDALNEIENLHQTITRLWKIKPSGLGINPSFCMLLAVFFHGIMHNGLNERGATHSLVYYMNISLNLLWALQLLITKCSRILNKDFGELFTPDCGYRYVRKLLPFLFQT